MTTATPDRYFFLYYDSILNLPGNVTQRLIRLSICDRETNRSERELKETEAFDAYLVYNKIRDDYKHSYLEHLANGGEVNVALL